jgi:NADPH-dependent 2,4-dienoyl-CoA reductase/sulfur reductase-like enzyme
LTYKPEIYIIHSQKSDFLSTQPTFIPKNGTSYQLNQPFIPKNGTSYQTTKRGEAMKVCIVGAGDAGAVAATQIRRLEKNAEIHLFSKRQDLGCPPCVMHLVLGRVLASWDELARGMRTISFYEKRNIEVHLDTEVTDIHRHQKYVIARGEKYDYDRLILALGATPLIPPFPGIDGKNEFVLSTDKADGVRLDHAISQHAEAAIIGGGYIGLEIAESLKSRGYTKIYVIVRRDILRAQLDKEMAKLVRETLKVDGVDLIMPAALERIKSNGHKKCLVLSAREIEVDFVFFATGATPNVELAQNAGLRIGETGGIVVNQYLRTSDPAIYAAGDCIENWDIIIGFKRQHQLATNAIRTGYIAGRNAVLGDAITYRGTSMPFVAKIFGLEIGSVGFTEREAQEKGFDTAAVIVETPWLKQRYNGSPAHYKLIGDRKTKALLGAQIISKETVAGVVDKLAVALATRMPLIQLLQIDSCYSPLVQENLFAVPLQRLINDLG